MRWVVVAALLVANTANAQEVIPCRPTANVPSALVCPGELVCNANHQCIPLRQPTPLRRGEAMRTGGIVLTIVGAGLFATSVYLFSQAGPGCYPLAARGDTNCATGMLVLLPALGSLGGGIAMWAVGQHRINQDARRAQLFITPVEGGAVAGMRLVDF